MLLAFFSGLLAGIESRNRKESFPRHREGSSFQPWSKVLLLLIERTLTINPPLAIFVWVGEAATPITEVREALVFERDPMGFIVFQGDESTTT